jgi:hypothetical protein
MPRSAVAYRRIASRLLSERGIAAVWQLHLDALSAHLNGYAGAAALMLAIADAAEEIVWWRTLSRGTGAWPVTPGEHMNSHATLRAEHNRRMARHFRSFAEEARDETLRWRLLRLAARHEQMAAAEREGAGPKEQAHAV